MTDFSEIVTVISGKLTQFRDNFVHTVAPVLSKALIRYQEAINSEAFKRGISALKEFFEVVYRYGTTHQKFCILSVELGWLPHPIVFPNGIIQVMAEYEANGEEAARAKLDSFYLEACSTDKLIGILAEWELKPHLYRRLEILKQAMDSHIEGKYYIAMPTFLAQIEGVLVDGYLYKGNMYGQKRKELLEKALSNKNWVSFDEAIYNIITNKVFGNFKHGENLDFEINRNAILHGANTDYGTKINSLKCILMFDYIQSKVGYVTFKGSKRHHKVNCSVVTRYLEKNPNATVEPYSYNDKYKEPCKICRPNRPIY
jgi:hypothetical protein